MTIYDRDEALGYRVIDRWENGFGWFAHPEETAKRASHAIRVRGTDCDETDRTDTDADDVWLVDPLWAPGIVDEIDALGTVAGVAVCFNWHARDADRFARHYDVSVHVPAWMDRVAERTDAPIERIAGTSTGAGTVELGDSSFRLLRYTPFPGWQEAIYHCESDGTLYVPETLATAPSYTVGDERLGVELLSRPLPPRTLLGGLEPERVLVGHGEGVLENATRALEDALANARRRFPRALLENGPRQFRALIAAMRE